VAALRELRVWEPLPDRQRDRSCSLTSSTAAAADSASSVERLRCVAACGWGDPGADRLHSSGHAEVRLRVGADRLHSSG